MQSSRDLVHTFFAAVAAGELPDAMLAPDMKGWTTTQGEMPKADYQRAIRLLARMTRGPLNFSIDSVTSEDDRVVAEVRSEGTLVNGEKYANTYVFVFRIHDGRIASVAEHFNALIVRDKLLPLMQTFVQDAGSDEIRMGKGHNP